jgi:eukaryotic translation initiation factor 2C
MSNLSADVTHPNPGSGAPSVAGTITLTQAVVCSYDKELARYHTYVRAQRSRTEIILDMYTIMLEAFKNYADVNGRPPEKVVYFRDGVASGQFPEVKATEVASIKGALEKLKNDGKLTVIVVTKRHHYRLFPQSNQDADPSGNCKPGTVVDSTITHPTECILT